MISINVLLIAVVDSLTMTKSEEVGLCSIAAFLRMRGHHVDIISIFEEEIDYGRLKEMAPDLIGFPVYSLSEACVARVAVRMKEDMPGVRILVGNVVPTYDGVHMLERYPFIDYAVVGEGELVIEELLSALTERRELSGIKGLIYRDMDRIVDNGGQQFIKNLDDLPFVARDMLTSKSSSAFISSIRGCRGNCSFCSSKLFKGPLRTRSPRLVADEVAYVYHTYGKRIFSFTDGSFEDSTDGSYDRIMELSIELRKRNLDIYYNVFMRSGFYKQATDELMDSLVCSGLYLSFVGVESGNEEDLKLYNKFATVEDNETIIHYLNDKHVYPDIGFINFNPYSTFSKIWTNLAFLHRTGFLFDTQKMNAKLNLYRGTTICNRVLDDRKIAKYNDLDYAFMDPRIINLYGILNKYTLDGNRKYDNIFNRIRQHIRALKLSLLADRIHYLRKDNIYGMNKVDQFMSIVDQHVRSLSDDMYSFYEIIILVIKGEKKQVNLDEIFNELIQDVLLPFLSEIEAVETQVRKELVHLWL